MAITAICSNPECDHAASTPRFEDVPDVCGVCGGPMLAACWKCGAAICDPAALYCDRCGVPLKRVLPRRDAAPFVLVCASPECDWASTGGSATAMPTRCPACGSEVRAECWKCGARIGDPRQHYCAACGVPLKRRRPVATGPTVSTRTVTGLSGTVR